MTGPTPSGLDRSDPPTSGVVRPFDFPPVESSLLPNGLGLKIAQMNQIPLVTLVVTMDAGESLLPDSSAGLAVLAGEGLDGGTDDLTGPEQAEAFEGIGAGLSVRTGWDSTTASVTCLAERLPEAMELLAGAMLRPAFPDDEVDRLRTQRLAAIQQRQMDPGSLADDAAIHFIYSDSSPYHRPLAGGQASIEGLRREDIQAFVQANYTPSGSAMVVVGDMENSEVEAMAMDHFGGWQGGPRAGLTIEANPRSSNGRVVIVHRPGAVQSEIRIGQVGVARSTPDFFPLKIFNTVLGGAFTSRLMLNLREERGYTYGVRSQFSHRRKAGPFSISMAVATEVTAPAVEEALGELKGLLEFGPDESEVDRARDYIAGTFPLHLETTGQVAARMTELQVYGLPDDFFGSYRDRIRKVTVAEAHAAGRRILNPEELVVVVAGDAEAVQGPLEDLGLGPVEVVSDF